MESNLRDVCQRNARVCASVSVVVPAGKDPTQQHRCVRAQPPSFSAVHLRSRFDSSPTDIYPCVYKRTRNTTHINRHMSLTLVCAMLEIESTCCRSSHRLDSHLALNPRPAYSRSCVSWYMETHFDLISSSSRLTLMLNAHHNCMWLY